MAADAFINCRVTPETKALVRALADQQGITESRLVKDLLEVILHKAVLTEIPTAASDRVTRSVRIYVRLQREDWLLLRERAGARRIPSATYVSLLVRSHLRCVAPLPKAEYLALKQSVAELSLVGRNLNQIARSMNQGRAPTPPGRAEVDAMLDIAAQLRRQFSGLLMANERSWIQGHPETAQ